MNFKFAGWPSSCRRSFWFAFVIVEATTRTWLKDVFVVRLGNPVCDQCQMIVRIVSGKLLKDLPIGGRAEVKSVSVDEF